MYPTGVRLVVTAVVSYAEYTCRVTNDAGSANVTAYVYAYSGNANTIIVSVKKTLNFSVTLVTTRLSGFSW